MMIKETNFDTSTLHAAIRIMQFGQGVDYCYDWREFEDLKSCDYQTKSMIHSFCLQLSAMASMLHFFIARFRQNML